MGKLTKKLTDTKLSLLGDIDVLLLPVCSSAIEMMQQVESYYVIPFDCKSNDELEKFLKVKGNAVLDASDAEMMAFASKHLNYKHNKGLDFIGRFNEKYIIGEAKFLEITKQWRN